MNKKDAMIVKAAAYLTAASAIEQFARREGYSMKSRSAIDDSAQHLRDLADRMRRDADLPTAEDVRGILAIPLPERGSQ